ncbi:hypothetical protein [Arsenophonus sp. PmNCSU2021_1]|uniref:hypothetical protein n=1 Tax=Arsenophonus sp. PmNCSU2021_1 TaxID=3118989 RepID=UPI002FF0EBA8
MLLHEQIEHLCESLKLNSVPTHWSSLAQQCIAQDKSYGDTSFARAYKILEMASEQ